MFAPLLAPHDPYAQNLMLRLRPPVWDDRGSWAYPLGTDNFGRDLLSRLIYGSRLSIVVGLMAMLVVLIFLITNIIVDASYAYLDPRVKLERAR